VTIAKLEPGRYLVVCSLPTDGEQHGEPHWMRGMYDTFVVR
jgi:hypothetical protein